MTETSDLGPMPDPQIDPKEPNPGGVDAVDEDPMPPAMHDLDPGNNPAVEDRAPDEISEPEDTDTEATEDESGDDHDETQESSG